MSTTLILSKTFRPPLRPDRVIRSRLIGQLNAGLEMQHRLTLVSAPAGYGKTTLLNEWVEQLALPAAWFSVGEDENDIARFLAYFTAALQGLHPAIGENIQKHLDALHESQIRQSQTEPAQPAQIGAEILSCLSNDTHRYLQGALLVLDDLHFVHNPAVHAILRRIVEHSYFQHSVANPAQGRGLHLVIASRVDPDLPLASFRARDWMTELREQDLRFNTEEMRSYFRINGVEINTRQSRLLSERTEGWVTSLQLFSQMLRNQKDVDPALQQFLKSHRYILDYLVEEVLQQQPHRVRRFLLQICILERFNPDLCEAVSGYTDSREMIHYLDENNLFLIPLDTEGGWYRFHRLFADLLQKQLNDEGEEVAKQLHLRAYRWLKTHEMIQAAVQHAYLAGQRELAEETIVRFTQEFLIQGRFNTALNWLNSLRIEYLQNSGFLLKLLAWFMLLNGYGARVEDYLVQASRAYDAISERENKPLPAYDRSLIDFFVIRAHLALQDGELARAEALALEGLENYRPGTDESTIANRPVQITGVFYYCLGEVYGEWGQLERSESCFLEAIRRDQAYQNHLSIAMSAYGLYHLYRMQAETGKARRLLDDLLNDYAIDPLSAPPALSLLFTARAQLALEQADPDTAAGDRKTATLLAEQSGWFTPQCHIQLLQAEQALFEGDTARARTCVDALQTQLADHTQPRLQRDADRWSLYLDMVEGDLRAARSRYPRLTGIAGASEDIFLECLLLLLEKDYAHAQAALDTLANDTVCRSLPGRQIEVHLLYAMLLEARGEEGAVTLHVQQAAKLGETSAYLYPFFKLRPFMSRRLALQLFPLLPLPSAPSHAPNPAGGQTLHRFAQIQPGRLTDPLSERELQVLLCLEQRLVNREIARQLHISVGTVKTHVHNILQKLQAGDRHAAVEKARQMVHEFDA